MTLDLIKCKIINDVKIRENLKKMFNVHPKSSRVMTYELIFYMNYEQFFEEIVKKFYTFGLRLFLYFRR